MAGFKQGGIEFKEKSVIGNPSTADHIIVYWNDLNDLIIKSSTGEEVIATESLLATISGNLQNQIDNLDTGDVTDISGLRTDVNTISGDLDSLETYTNGITGGLTQINETISKSWSSLVNIWTTEPTFNINISGEGDVYNYVYDTTTYFRLVPEPYDSTQDIFYSNFNGIDTLTGVVATRGQGL